MAIDIDAYCARIGYDGPRTPTLDTLRSLHRLQPQAIAFENLDPLLGKPPSLDPAALFDKLIARNRGGYCYEQNLLLAEALTALGFRFRYLTGWPRWRIAPGRVMPRTHLLFLVESDGEEWVADVGFGGNTMTAPLLLRSRQEQVTLHEPMRMIDKDCNRMIQAKIGGEWQDLLEFNLDHQTFAEIEMANWFSATHPTTRFTKELLLARTEPDRRYGLLDNVLTTHRRGQPSTRRRLSSAGELRDVITDLFLITPPDDAGLEPMLARIAEKAS